MITVADAVREFGGKWQSPKGVLVVHDDNSYEFCDVYNSLIDNVICTRAEFEEEALKSDRERWLKMASDITGNLLSPDGRGLKMLHEALKSGELPIPEK